MLDKIREQKTGWLSWLLTIIIIVVFVAFFGPGSFRKTKGGCGVKAYAAKIDSATVAIEDYNFAYMSRKREMSARSGGKLDRNMEKALNLKQMVMDEMVDLEILTQTARRMGLVITDDELNKSIMNDPAFQNQGQFDFQLYTRVVRFHFQITLKKFEERQRSRLLAQKVVGMMRGLVRMSDDEVWDEYARKNNQVNLQYAAFELPAFRKDVKVTDTDITALLAGDRQKVEAYFKAHEGEYNTARKVRARHILLKTGKDASEGEVKDAKAKADKLTADLKGGAVFDALAKEHSDDPGSKEKGGDLDWFEKGRMVKEFEEAAFSLKKGEMTQTPVKTPFGFHIIRVDDVKEAVKVEMKVIERPLARAMLEEQMGDEAAKAAAGKALAELKAGKKLTDLFPVQAENPETPPEPGTGPGHEKDAPGVTVKETGLFAKSSSYVPQLGVAPELSEAAFTLTTAQPVPDKVFRVATKYCVVQLKERQTPDRAKFETEKDSFAQQVAMSKQAGVITEWIKSLREGVHVDVNKDLVSYDGKPMERERIYDDF